MSCSSYFPKFSNSTKPQLWTSNSHELFLKTSDSENGAPLQGEVEHLTSKQIQGMFHQYLQENVWTQCSVQRPSYVSLFTNKNRFWSTHHYVSMALSQRWAEALKQPKKGESDSHLNRVTFDKSCFPSAAAHSPLLGTRTLLSETKHIIRENDLGLCGKASRYDHYDSMLDSTFWQELTRI